MPVLDIVITQYLDSSYRGRLGQRPGTVPEYGICWALMCTHPFFKYPRQNLGTGSVRVQCFCLVPGQSTSLHSLVCSSFKVSSDRAKGSDNVHGYIAGTEGVNTVPFCAGTRAL